MKINPRVYEVVNTEPLETQEVEGHIIEIYRLDDYPAVLEEFTKKGKFAVWSSVDGKNYRLLIEDGYHKTLKDLYGKRVNGVWVKFWDECEKVSNKFSRKIILPLTILVLVVYFILSSTVFTSDKIGPTASTIFALAIPGTFIILVMFLRRYTNNKISMENARSIDEIKKILGAKRFEELLEAQRGYLDEYFGYNDEEELDADDNTMEAEVIESTNIEVVSPEVEVVETFEEKVVEETIVDEKEVKPRTPKTKK